MQFFMFQMRSNDAVAYVLGDVADFFPAPCRIDAADRENHLLHISSVEQGLV